MKLQLAILTLLALTADACYSPTSPTPTQTHHRDGNPIVGYAVPRNGDPSHARGNNDDVGYAIPR